MFHSNRVPVARLRVVCPIVDLHRQHVLVSPAKARLGDVDAVRGHAVLREPDRLAVEEDVPRLSHAFELAISTLPSPGGRQFEMLAVPGQSLVCAAVAAAVRDDRAKRIDSLNECGVLTVSHLESSKSDAAAPSILPLSSLKNFQLASKLYSCRGDSGGVNFSDPKQA